MENITNAIIAKDWAKAERELTHQLSESPNNAQLHYYLAVVLANTGRYDESVKRLEFSLSELPNETFELLARVYWKIGDYEAALKTTESLIKETPGNPAFWQLRGDIAQSGGRTQEALTAYMRSIALDPDNVTLIYRYAYLQNLTNQDDAITVLQEVCRKRRTHLPTFVRIIRMLVPYLEERHRRQRGLPAGHGLSSDDLRIRFAATEMNDFAAAAEEWLSQEPNHLDAAIMAGLAFGMTGRFEAAESAFSRVRHQIPNDVLASVDFSPTFMDRVESSSPVAVLAKLPPTRMLVSPATTQQHTLFVGADKIYFEKYVRALIHSHMRTGSNVAVHAHVFDGDEADLLAFHGEITAQYKTTLSISIETTYTTPENGPVYFHAIRFVRLLEFIKNFGGNAWMIDADMVVNRDPMPLFDALRGYDVSLWVQPSRIEANNKIQASLVGIGGSTVGLNYLQRTSAYLVELLCANRLRWGADQAALYVVLQRMLETLHDVKIAFVTEQMFDGTRQADRLLWPGK